MTCGIWQSNMHCSIELGNITCCWPWGLERSLFMCIFILETDSVNILLFSALSSVCVVNEERYNPLDVWMFIQHPPSVASRSVLVISFQKSVYSFCLELQLSTKSFCSGKNYTERQEKRLNCFTSSTSVTHPLSWIRILTFMFDFCHKIHSMCPL